MGSNPDILIMILVDIVDKIIGNGVTRTRAVVFQVIGSFVVPESTEITASQPDGATGILEKHIHRFIKEYGRFKL